MEKLILSFGPVSYQPPTVGGVDGFSSGSVTLDKRKVGKRGPYLHSFYSASLH